MKLAHKVLLTLVVIIFGLFSVTTSFEISRLRKQFEAESQGLHSTILANILSPLGGSLYNFDEDGIKRVVSSTFEFGKIQHLVVLDERAEIVAAYGIDSAQTANPLDTTSIDSLALQRSKLQSPISPHQTKTIEMLRIESFQSLNSKRLTAPLWFVKDDKQKFLGHVILDYSTDSVESLLRDAMLAKSGSAFFLAIIMSATLFTVIRKSVLVRLEKLKAGVDRIKVRDYSVDLSSQGKDEIATLSNAFADMVSEIANYQKGLENKVNERTQDLRKSRDKVKLILDHIDEGILTFSAGMLIEAEFSKKTCEVLEKSADGIENSPVLDILFKRSNLTPDEISLLQESLSFSLDAEDLAWIGNQHNFPSEIVVGTNILGLSWIPILDEQTDTVERVLLTIRDKTRERLLEQQQKQEEIRNKRILSMLKVIQHSGFSTVDHFLKHGSDVTANLLKGNSGNQAGLIEMHSLKGEARTMHLQDIADLAHEVESLLKSGRPGQARTAFEQLLEIFQDYKNVLELLEHSHGEEQLSFVSCTSKILETIAARTAESGLTCGRFELIDEAHDIDSTLIHSVLRPCLIHAINNALDHGYIFPEANKGLNKAVHIRVRAYRERDLLVVEIADQGYGLNPEFIYRKAKEKGIATEGLQPEEILFLPEFSTASSLSVTSGRGVGMSAIKLLVEAHKGSVKMVSQENQGSLLTLRLPEIQVSKKVA